MSRIKHFISLSWMSALFHIGFVFSAIRLSLLVVIDDMAEDLQTTTTSVGIIMSMYMFPVAISGPFWSYAMKIVGCRVLMIIGGVLISSGIFMMAFAGHVAFIAIGFSFLIGIGTCAIYTACTTAIRLHYSNRHYALANGAAITGIPLSMFVFSPIIRVLVFTYGWRGALVIASATSLNSLVVGALMKPKYIIKRAAVINDDDNVFEDKNDVDSVEDGNNKMLLLLPYHAYDQLTTSVLPTIQSQDQTSYKGVVNDSRGSDENPDITHANHSRESRDSPVPCIDEHFEIQRSDNICTNKMKFLGSDSAPSDTHDEEHVKVSIKSNQGSRRSIDSTKNNVSTDSPSSVGNDNAEPYVVKSTFRISKLFKLSTKPLTKTTKTCHLILYVAIFFLSATYTTGNIFLVSAGTHGGLTPMQAATLLSGFGISNAVGRFCNGILVTKGCIKVTHLYIVMQILMTASSLVLGFLMKVYVMAILGSLAFGVSAGTLISLNVVMQRVIDDCATSISLGWLILVEGFGGLFGSLLLGSLKDLTDSFVPMFVLFAVSTSMSAALSVLIIILKKREVNKHKLSSLSC